VSIILPVGISFYTFQSMSYTIDVYRGKMAPVRDLTAFVLYVSYFPQLVAGPIERATHLLPALMKRRVVNEAMVRGGVMLIIVGLFRKVVIADGIGQTVDRVFASPAAHSSGELLAAAYLFALQIYCDFAGYSDIARGVSRLLGIDLMINFEQPYFASSLREFWRRWHISLSTWLRDYLYIPLGGSRGSQLATMRNLMITMLLGGLWHGAAWSFVAWGLLHGGYLAVEHLTHRKAASLAERLRLPAFATRALGIVTTFHLVLLAWVFFRAPGFSAAIGYLEGIASGFAAIDPLAVLAAVALPWLLVLTVDIPQRLANDHTVFLGLPAWPRAAVASAMLFLVCLGFGTRAPFIYFQF
jgi:D-alanyl-lipoteichoic acid acyltransferase DltB (MBOAT superfamily)